MLKLRKIFSIGTVKLLSEEAINQKLNIKRTKNDEDEDKKDEEQAEGANIDYEGSTYTPIIGLHKSVKLEPIEVVTKNGKKIQAILEGSCSKIEQIKIISKPNQIITRGNI